MNSSKYYQIQDLYPHLTHKERYKGTHPITARSGWEIKFVLNFLDKHASVVQWASESVVIPYLNPNDNKMHRYFVDFWVRVRQEDGKEFEYLIEIKPFKETQKPTGAKNTRRLKA